MAYEADSTDAEGFAIRLMVEQIAKNHGEESPMPVGYILACEYIADDGERLWALRYDPRQGYGTSLGLAKLVELDTERIARETLGLDAVDDE